jgi:hypothetical protein
MSKKDKSSDRRSKSPKSSEVAPPTTPDLEKAVPPPDNPLLRHQAEAGPEAGTEDAQKEAKARLEAIRQTREMKSDERDTPSPTRDD